MRTTDTATCALLADEPTTNNRPTAALSDDLLHGVRAIAQHMGLKDRQIYHLASSGCLPVFRMGITICARKSTLNQWVIDQERAATRKA